MLDHLKEYVKTVPRGADRHTNAANVIMAYDEGNPTLALSSVAGLSYYVITPEIKQELRHVALWAIDQIL